MREIKLTKEQAEGMVIMHQLAKMAKMCIRAETHPLMPMKSFAIFVTRKAPSGSKGVILPGKPMLMGEFVAEEERGWQAAVDCEHFRDYLMRNFHKAPEVLIAEASAVFGEEENAR